MMPPDVRAIVAAARAAGMVLEQAIHAGAHGRVSVERSGVASGVVVWGPRRAMVRFIAHDGRQPLAEAVGPETLARVTRWLQSPR